MWKNYEYFIAHRYLISRKSHNAINIISAVSVVGVAVATMALVCTLSVFNGFQDMVAGLFTAFDPQLRISLTESSSIRADHPSLLRLKQCPLVDVYTPMLEEQALVVRNDRQYVISLLGVEDSFVEQAQIEDILYGEGEFSLHADEVEYGVAGIQLASQLGLGTTFEEPLRIYAPKRGERVNMAAPQSSFHSAELYSPGVVFMVRQAEYDGQYIISSLGFAQNLFDRQGQISHVGIKLKPGVSVSSAREEIRSLLGEGFLVQDRYEQQDDVFRIMRIEKLISYIFLTFILLVACFNIIGSLSMLMIEKKADVQTLRSMGATEKQICRIFMLEGRLISLCGAVLGLLLGLALCWAQQEFGLITMGESEGSFIIDTYPVSVQAMDLLLIFLTVLVVGWITVWYPVRAFSRSLLQK